MRHVPEELMQAVEDQIDATHDKNPAAIEKERLWNLVSDITLFTMANREVLLKEAAKEQEDLLDRIRKGDANQQFLEPPSRYLAEKLYDFWAKKEQLSEDILVVEGRCTHLLHQWFEICGRPDRLEEPNFKFIIDPNPLGIAFGHTESPTMAYVKRASVVIFEPYSVWQEAYTGKVIRGVEPEHRR